LTREAGGADAVTQLPTLALEAAMLALASPAPPN
jgi:hypothetical protein